MSHTPLEKKDILKLENNILMGKLKRKRCILGLTIFYTTQTGTKLMGLDWPVKDTKISYRVRVGFVVSVNKYYFNIINSYYFHFSIFIKLTLIVSYGHISFKSVKYLIIFQYVLLSCRADPKWFVSCPWLREACHVRVWSFLTMSCS